MEIYLVKLAKRLGYHYTGTVIKGGVEGIQTQPERMTRKLFHSFYQLGVDYSKTREFNNVIIEKLTKGERLHKWIIFGFKVMQKIGIINFYWDSQLKQNKAFEKRFTRTFTE